MIRTSGNGDGVIAASETAEAKENAEKKKKRKCCLKAKRRRSFKKEGVINCIRCCNCDGSVDHCL